MRNFDAVTDLLRHVARNELLTRFRRLAAGDVQEKSAGEVVTVADTAAERALTSALVDLLPGSVVVGEEATHRDPDLLRHIADHDAAWAVDPLDGTRHFAAGEGPFGIMVALLRRGTVRAAWIHLPLEDCVLAGQVDRGVALDGVIVTVPAAAAPLRGALHTRFLPPDVRERVDAESTLQRTESAHKCAARQYVDIVRGREHFALYYRTLPWDHAPGAFLVAAAGGVARRLDGSAYVPGDGGSGLLVASNEAVWHDVRERVLG